MTRSIFAQLFGRFLLLLFGVIVVVAASFTAGARISIERWSTRIGDRLRDQVASELSGLLRQNADPGPREVQLALRPLLNPGVQLRVYDRQGELIIAFQRGMAVVPSGRGLPPVSRGQEPSPNARRMEPPGDPAAQLGPQRLSALTPVQDTAGEPALYFSVRNEGFLMDETNRILFLSVLRALLIGLGAATLLSALGAYSFSRRLSRSTSAISSALSDVSAGKRDVTVVRGHITELNQIADDTEYLQDVLVREERLRAQWAQDVAHDLRTPVTALRAQLEGVRDGVLDSGAQRVEKMLVQVERVECLVDSLNELTRLESPDTRIQLSEIGVDELSRYIRSVVLPSAECAAGMITFRDTSASNPVLADRDLVARACANLVDNAIRYRTSGTDIRIATDVSAERFVFSVINAGTLVEEPDQLFERLTRGELSRGTPGSGLGLTIVRAIAARHNGNAALHALPDSQVEARFELPLT